MMEVTFYPVYSGITAVLFILSYHLIIYQKLQHVHDNLGNYHEIVDRKKPKKKKKQRCASP